MAVSRINEAGLNVNQYGNRNLIINGAMQVAQRGTSSTGLGASNGYFTCDRWKAEFDSTAGRLTMTQDSSAPSGFANSLKLDCTTADTSIAAGELFLIQQRIEGQDLQRFAKGTSDAKPFAVSFYVKGNASATYVAELFDQDNSRHVAKTFSVTTDWTRVELSFPADTTGGLDDDNARSLDLNIWLHAGSTYSSGTLPATWASNTNANRAAGGSSFFDSTARTFFITGVQLEVGDTATDFEHRTFGDELAKCQRYYYRVDADDSYKRYADGFYYATTAAESLFNLPVTMRAEPSLESTGTPANYAYYDGASVRACTNLVLNAGSDKTYMCLQSVAGTTTQGFGAVFLSNNNTDSFIAASAEL